MTRRGFFQCAAGVGAASTLPASGLYDGKTLALEGFSVDQGNGKVTLAGGRSNHRGTGGQIVVQGAARINGVYFENMIVPADTQVIFRREQGEA